MAQEPGRAERRWGQSALAFRLERFFDQGVHTKVLALWLLLLLLSLLAGGLAWLSPATHFDSVSDAVFWAFLRLTDPGHLAEDRAPGLLLLSIVTSVVGLVVFVGVLVAIITQAFIEQMERLALGLEPVAYQDHVVVLGWTNRSLELVSAVLAARPDSELAVLVPRIDGELEQTLRETLPRRLRRRLVLRTGEAEEVEHLHRVLGRGPREIAIPGSDRPEPGVGDARTLKVIASLDRAVAGLGGAPPRVVAEILDPRLNPVARSAYRGAVDLVPTELLLARSIGLGILSPGLSGAMADILDARSGHTLRIESLPGLERETLAGASRRLENAVALGVLRARDGDDELLVDPAMSLARDERLLLLAPVGARVASRPGSERDEDVAPVGTPAAGAADPAQRRVLVLGWSAKVPVLHAELARLMQLRCEMDVVSRVAVEERERVLPADASLRHRVADAGSPDTLDALDLGSYDSVVVLGSVQARDASDADSRTVARVLLLEHRLAGLDRRPHLIAELLDASNRAVLEGRGVEIVVTPDLAAGLLAGMLNHPDLGSILGQMLLGRLGSPGVVPLIRLLGEAPASLRFGALEARAHAAGLRCIGVQRESRDFALELVPAKDDLLDVGERDRAVVLSAPPRR